jgi:beta-lactamase class A
MARAAMFAGAAVMSRDLARGEAKEFAQLEQRLASIEEVSGGRLGVAVFDTASGQRFGYRADERFPMCSTFKVLLVGAVLKRVDEGKEQLDRIMHYTRGEVLEYAPITRPHPATGMTVNALCEAAITLSDNTAANLLLKIIGGPAGVTAFARSLGDSVTRLDRTEPTLNTAILGDPRDTSTPMWMLRDLQKLALGNALQPASRRRLVSWLLACKTGDARLRAGLPAGWRVGDKTGTGDHGTSNDVAIVWPEREKPLLVAAYLTGVKKNEDQDGLIAAVGGAVFSGWQNTQHGEPGASRGA